MELFHVIADGVAHLRGKNGIYRQVKVYHRGADVFAAHGGGYVRLIGNMGTSNPDITCTGLDAPGVTVGNNGKPTWVGG